MNEFEESIGPPELSALRALLAHAAECAKELDVNSLRQHQIGHSHEATSPLRCSRDYSLRRSETSHWRRRSACLLCPRYVISTKIGVRACSE